MDDGQAGVDTTLFREVCGQYATGVAVISVAGENGQLAGVTVNSFSSVSLEPPLVQFSLDRKASVFPLFQDCGYFAVNVLSRKQQSVSNMFAVRSDGFDELPYTAGVGGCPVLDDCVANIECEKFSVYDGGDHIIILGKVMRLKCAPTIDPLLFFRGTYGTFS
ncbi:MAG: flavin reductase family protein [Pseudomonadota bacterium]